MTKILIFIDWFLPGYKAGGPISSNANLIDHLSDKFEFYVVTRDTDYCESVPYKNINADTWNKLPNGANVYYISAKKLGFSKLVKVCKSIEFDIVYVNGIYSPYFSLFPLVYFKYFTRKKVIISSRGMLSDHTFSAKKGKKKLFYGFARIVGLYKGITFHATNEDEALQIRKNVGFSGTIKVAPNMPPKSENTFDRTITKRPGELKLISVARISPEKNTLFALKILEKLRSVHRRQTTDDRVEKVDRDQKEEERKVEIEVEENQTNLEPGTWNLVFDLYGTIYSTSYWEECQQVIKHLPSNIKVRYCGTLEKEKITATLGNYHFLFMPSQGENYGHSIVESFLAGCPVIISDRTPWRNLDTVQSSRFKVQNSKNQVKVEAKDERNKPELGNLNLDLSLCTGWDIPLDDPDKFVEIINKCLEMDQEEYLEISRNAFNYGQSITNDSEVMKENEQIFD